MIFRTDLTGSFSLNPSIKNNIPLNTIPISAIQINFAAPGQCMTLNKKASNIKATASEEKMILNFSRPDVSFPTNELIIRTAVRTPAAAPIMKMTLAPAKCWLLNNIPQDSSMLETRAPILIIFIITSFELI